MNDRGLNLQKKRRGRRIEIVMKEELIGID